VKTTDIFETTKQRTLFGTVWKTVLAGTCDEIGTGKTKDEAEAEALLLVKAQVANAHRRAYFTSPSGKTLFIVSFQWGWSYDIVRDGKSRGVCCTGDTFEQCCGYAARHAADYEECD